MTSATTTPRRDPGRWMVLWACIVATLMVAIDSGIITLIVPSIQKDFDAPQATVGLMSSISTLMLAAFILGGGKLGDIYGRRRLILIGTGGIVAAAILSMLASNAGVLIAIRGMDGICQALVNPLALAIITVTFDAEERPKALGIYGASLGIMGGLSSLIIQYFNQAFGWRSVFTLVIGLGILTIILMIQFVGESKASGGSQKIDLLGIILCAAGLFSLIYGISQASGAGGFFSGSVLFPAIIGAAVLGLFVWWEGRFDSPALELSLFKQPAFSLGAFLVLLLSFAQIGVFFHLSNYFQVLLKKSPLESALMLLPLTLSLFVFSIVAGSLVNRFPTKSLIVCGTLTLAFSLFLFAGLISPNLSGFTAIVPMLLLGAGMAIANIPRTNALLSSAPPALAGMASATNNAFMQLGNAMGVAVTVALVTTFGRNYYFGELTKAGLNDEQISRANQLLKQILSTDVPSVASQFAIPQKQLEGLVGNYQAAFTTGITQMMLVAAIALVLAAVVVWFGWSSAGVPASKTHTNSL